MSYFQPQYPPQPFKGAPPPIPPNLGVDPSFWQRGQWLFNPAFKQAASTSSNTSQVPWLPSRAWNMQQQPPPQPQQQQNPFQRPSKPPSKAYLDLPVSANNALGLDLNEMIPREQLYTSDPELPHTPWIWNPRGLVEEGKEEGIISADFRDREGRTVFRESRGATPTRRQSHEHSATATPSPSPLRHQRKDSQSSRHHQRTPSRQSSDPTPFQSQAQAPARRGTDPAAAHRDSDSDDIPLRPTFSSKIVCTPDHYRSQPSSRSNSRERYPTVSSASSSHHYDPVRTVDADHPIRIRKESSLRRHESMPAQTSEGQGQHLSTNTSADAAAVPRPLSRHHTHPTLSVIPERTTYSPATIYSSRPQTPHSASSPSTSSPSSYAPSSRRSSSYSTPYSSTSQSSYYNSLPSPPRDTRSPSPVIPPPPQVRKGWWNCRGDHLTEDGKIVYAPSKYKYPEELAQYPPAESAWMNERGKVKTIKPGQTWPELEESLPRGGRKPVRPYKSFIIYV